MNEPLIERAADRDGTGQRRFVAPDAKGGLGRPAARLALRASVLAPAVWLAVFAGAAAWFAPPGSS